MKTPIVISTLEEDFKKIGLIKANLVESVQAEEVEEAELDEADEELEEGKRPKKRSVFKDGRVQVVKLHRQTSTERSKGRMRYKRKKTQILRRRKKRGNRADVQRHSDKVSAFAAKKGTRMSRKDKKAMKRGLNTSVDYAELMKSLANAAIIAENLQTIFTEWYEADEFDAEADEVLVDFVEQLEAIAEDFADAATELHESADGEEIDDDLVEMFKEGLDIVLDAVDLYEATKEEASDDEGMCEECDDEECEGCEGND